MRYDAAFPFSVIRLFSFFSFFFNRFFFLFLPLFFFCMGDQQATDFPLLERDRGYTSKRTPLPSSVVLLLFQCPDLSGPFFPRPLSSPVGKAKRGLSRTYLRNGFRRGVPLFLFGSLLSDAPFFSSFSSPFL